MPTSAIFFLFDQQCFHSQVGVDIISGYAKFAGPNEVLLQDGRSFKFRKCILGTGAAWLPGADAEFE